MGLSSMDLFAVRYMVRPGPIRGRGSPLSQAERQALYRLRKKGEVPPYPRLAADLYANAERDEATGCLIWMRARKASGYGTIKRNGRQVYAHRASLEAKLGRPLGPGMMACHTCDNPPCIEPEHLFEGAATDNMADRHSKGWYVAQRAGQ